MNIETDTTPEAILARALWDSALDELLQETKWEFAKKSVILARDSIPVVDTTYKYPYQLPSDYIKMARVNGFYVIKGTHLYSNAESVILEYISRITDATKYPTFFTSALEALLSLKMYMPLGKRAARSVNWESRYLFALDTAKLLNAQESNKTIEQRGGHTIKNDTWLKAARV